jgi:predicted transposase/invertase (TIGR01784 family)
MAKVFTYLKQNNPGQPFCGVVLFASRSLEPKELIPYRHMIAADQIRRYYLEELEELPNAPLGLSILCLIRHAENHAPEVARELIVRVKSEIEDKSLQVDLIDLIETVIIYKLPKLGRAEIQAMLQIHDIRESRVYQEAREEGKVEGLKVGIEKGIAISIAKLAAKNKSLAEIAALLDLNVDQVQQALKNVDRN